jgi:toluene monooxygenase electron transfer component
MNPRPEAAPFAIEIDGMQACVPCDGGDTILGALLRAGCGVPYECSAGGCGSCKFTLISGALSEDVAEPAGLKASERSRGKWLACVSRATANCRIAVRLDPQYVPAVRPRRVTATFLSSRRITHDISEFVFCSKGDAQFLPGQYAKLSLPGLAGPRNYSMCNTANAAGLWHFGIRRVPGGLASQVLFDQLTVGTEVEIERDPETGAVVLTPVRPSASALLELRDALLQEPGFRAELDAFFEGLHDTRPAEPVDFP